MRKALYTVLGVWGECLRGAAGSVQQCGQTRYISNSQAMYHNIAVAKSLILQQLYDSINNLTRFLETLFAYFRGEH